MIAVRSSLSIPGESLDVHGLARRLALPFPLSIRDLIAAKEIASYHAANLGDLTVGAKRGALVRDNQGNYTRSFNFGTIVKPKNDFPDVGDRFHVTVTLAGVRCFGTDDPSGTDEPYLIATVTAIDPRDKEKSTQTSLIGPGDVGDIESGQVFGQNRDLIVDIAVPGDADIAINLQLFDVETISNPAKTAKVISDIHTAQLVAGVATLAAFVPVAGAIVGGVLAIAQATGLLQAFSDAIGSAIANAFSDDHLGTVDLRITHDYLMKLRDDPDSLDRTSLAIGGETYNFPQLPEDDSEAGKSWMFRQEGKGTYRPFFRVVMTEK
jgi:hypothetical protein